LYRRTVPSEYEGEAQGCAERSRGGLEGACRTQATGSQVPLWA